MATTFYKYQGTGNDFILIDNRTLDFEKSEAVIAHLCHRRFGIGADGLILLENDPNYDFKMVYYNADGREGSMCGNGGRCIVKFAYDLGIITAYTSFTAIDGLHEATVSADVVSLKMMDVSEIDELGADTFMNTGSPHFIREVNSVEDFDVFTQGRSIRTSPEWAEKGGVNVNFIAYQPENQLFVRTYERGVEDETYSCGTGVTAAAIHAVLRGGYQTPVGIKTRGGNLSVNFNHDVFTGRGRVTDIYLSGPALRVFSGKY